MNRILEIALKVAAGREMTPEERFEQAVSWCYGQLPAGDTRTKDDIRAQLRKSMMSEPKKD